MTNIAQARPADSDILKSLVTRYYMPLVPSERDQGDPYILEVPESAGTEFRFYVYISDEGPLNESAVPCFGTNDLETFSAFSGVLQDSEPRAHWAPCVRYISTLPRPYVMLYSRSVALGERCHIGHQIRRADSERPEGPFVDTNVVLTDDTDFAIDADVTVSPDGDTRLAYATDFVDDEPYGTGIVQVAIDRDLTHLDGAPQLLARARKDYQVFEPARSLPWKNIPRVDWNRGETVTWYTVEAPAYLPSPAGRQVILYSTGCFYKDNYAVGALVENEAGELIDVTTERDHFVMRSQPDSRLYSLGHPSIFQLAGQDFLMIHVREGSVDAPRQMTVVPLLWTDEGLPYCPPKQDLAAYS